MNRVYPICPQCKGKGCTDIACKFSGIKHEAMDKINASIKLAKVEVPLGVESAMPWLLA